MYLKCVAIIEGTLENEVTASLQFTTRGGIVQAVGRNGRVIAIRSTLSSLLLFSTSSLFPTNLKIEPRTLNRFKFYSKNRGEWFIIVFHA